MDTADPEMSNVAKKEKPAIKDLLTIHRVIDRLFFDHQKALLHFDFAGALRCLESYESALLVHMRDEEEIILPIYSERAEPSGAGSPQLFFDDHSKMRSYIEAFKDKTAELASDESPENALLLLLDREAFYKRLCSHHDKREGEFLYPILDDILSDEEKRDLLDRLTFREAANPHPLGV